MKCDHAVAVGIVEAVIRNKAAQINGIKQFGISEFAVECGDSENNGAPEQISHPTALAVVEIGKLFKTNGKWNVVGRNVGRNFWIFAENSYARVVNNAFDLAESVVKCVVPRFVDVTIGSGRNMSAC